MQVTLFTGKEHTSKGAKMNRIVSVAFIGWALVFFMCLGPFCVLQWEQSIG